MAEWRASEDALRRVYLGGGRSKGLPSDKSAFEGWSQGAGFSEGASLSLCLFPTSLRLFSFLLSRAPFGLSRRVRTDPGFSLPASQSSTRPVVRLESGAEEGTGRERGASSQ